MTTNDEVWVPEACTLPTAERPLRLAGFDDLFATALHGQQRLSPTRLRWSLDPAAQQTARDLTGRESACCSFFAFTFAAGGDLVQLDVEVPRGARRRAGRARPPGRRRDRSVTGLRSGQIAAAAGVNLQTLRYYERRGLLAEPRRSLGGHRLYPAEAVTVLRVIKAAQRLGFTLDEVADLLDAGRHRHGRRADTGLRARARTKLAEVEAKIADLRVIAGTLRAAVDAGCDDLVACAGEPRCPIPFATIARAARDADAR
jgi:DNA-binding transcriptional MerR regulator